MLKPSHRYIRHHYEFPSSWTHLVFEGLHWLFVLPYWHVYYPQSLDWLYTIEFSLNVLPELAQFSGKKYYIWKRLFEPVTSLPGCYHSASKTHVRDRILKLTPIHVSVIYQIPRIRLIHWIFVCHNGEGQLVSKDARILGAMFIFLWSCKKLPSQNKHTAKNTLIYYLVLGTVF